MEGPFLVFYFFALWCGLLLPIPSLILAWREWSKTGKTPPINKSWRRLMSHIALFICTLGVLMWVYTMAVEWRDVFAPSALPLPSSWVISVGSWEAFPAIAISALAESKLRKYLLVSAVGLFFFFNWTVGEAI
jgi:hypothetical protein